MLKLKLLPLTKVQNMPPGRGDLPIRVGFSNFLTIIGKKDKKNTWAGCKKNHKKAIKINKVRKNNSFQKLNGKFFYKNKKIMGKAYTKLVTGSDNPSL